MILTLVPEVGADGHRMVPLNLRVHVLLVDVAVDKEAENRHPRHGQALVERHSRA